MEPEKATWLPTLYKLDNKDKFRVFRVGYTRGGMCTESGMLYKANGEPGKLICRLREVDANNRSETVRKASKAKAYQEWEKKQRIDRFASSDKPPKMKDVDKWKDDIKWPAVCKAWKMCKDSDKECTPDKKWYGQGKANGDRSMAWKDVTSECGVRLLSRKCVEKKFMTGIRKDCTTIFKYLEKTYPGIGDVGIDGEVFVPDEQHHQTSRSIASRSVNKHDDEDRLVLHVFDIMEYTLPFRKRYRILKNLAENLGDLKHVTFLKTQVLESNQEVAEFMAYCAANGFEEGIVLRRPHLLYSAKKEHKHKDMLKLKKTEDAEFEVIGYKCGKSDRKGCVVWKLKDPANKKIKFWCDQVGTVEYTRELFDNAEDYMGRLITVEFSVRSEDGIPIMPHAIRFRDADDIASAEESSSSE